MAPIWPFNRKETGASKAKPAEEKKVVSYEREQGDSQREKLEDRAHLEDEGFKDLYLCLLYTSDAADE